MTTGNLKLITNCFSNFEETEKTWNLEDSDNTQKKNTIYMN